MHSALIDVYILLAKAASLLKGVVLMLQVCCGMLAAQCWLYNDMLSYGDTTTWARSGAQDLSDHN